MSAPAPEPTWPASSWPTAEQLFVWLTQGQLAAEGWQIETLRRSIDAMQRSARCFEMDHEATIEQQGLALRVQSEDLQEMEARVRNLIADLERKGPRPDKRWVLTELWKVLGQQRPVETVPTILDNCGDYGCLLTAGHDGPHAIPSPTYGDPSATVPVDATPHQVAHMSNGRCSLGSVSHDPHDGCAGVSAGPTYTMGDPPPLEVSRDPVREGGAWI